MPGTYSQILLHIVYSTKNRQPYIPKEVEPRLHAYIGGIVRAEGGALYSSGGMNDHVHHLIRWKTDAAISDLMRTIKSRSSNWMHETFPKQPFAWQEGYAVFSVSKSAEQSAKRYIDNQAEHHKVRDFKAELRALLIAHGVAFDERHAFD
jgi:REP element-mobilizing transposase RayT